MKIPDFVKGFLLAKLAKDIENGKYGPTAARVYTATKGYKTLTSFGLGAIGGSLIVFGSPYAATLGPALVTLGVLGASFGIWDKGVEKTPPKSMPAELRDAFAAALSVITVIGTVANGLVSAAQAFGDPRAIAISAKVQLFAAALTAATGYLSTFLDDQTKYQPNG